MNSATQLDHMSELEVEDAVELCGIRAVLGELVRVCDRRAERAVKNFNTVQGKQWAAWSVAIEALAANRKLRDPGRE